MAIPVTNFGGLAYTESQARRLDASPSLSVDPAMKWAVNEACNGIVITSSYLFTVVASNKLRRIALADGSITDFSVGAGTLGTAICAGSVSGVERVYLLVDVGTASPDLICVNAATGSVIWTRTFAAALYTSFTVHTTTAGVLILTVDASPNYLRATRDDGSGYTALWQRTDTNFAGVRSSDPGASVIVTTDGSSNVYKLAASDGTGSPTSSTARTGTAAAISDDGAFAYFWSGAAQPYNVLRVRLSDMNLATLTNPLSSDLGSVPALLPDGTVLVWFASHGGVGKIRAYDTAWSLQWSYDHSAPLVNVLTTADGKIVLVETTAFEFRAASDRALIKRLNLPYATNSTPLLADNNSLVILNTTSGITMVDLTASASRWVNGYSYRMSIPVTNPKAAGNRHIVVPFPAWYLKARGKIAQASCADVVATKSDGSTTLPTELSPAKDALLIDYANMPLGRTTVYVYYGSFTALAPPACSFKNEVGGTLLDNGFEDGTPATNLVSPWLPDGALPPATYQYNHDFPRRGSPYAQDSRMEALIVAPSGNYGGIYETVTNGINQDGAEIRFWIRFNATTKRHQIRDRNATERTFNMWWESDGTIQVITNQTQTGYTQGGATAIGTYQAGVWYQFRIQMNFTTKKLRIDYRTRTSTYWTALKASGALAYDIPMYGTNPTSHAGSAFFGYDGATWRIDDYRYSTTPMVDQPAWQYRRQTQEEYASLLDAGFENGTLNNNLGSEWTIETGAACIYDNSQWRDTSHSKKHAKVTGAAGGYAGFYNSGTAMNLTNDYAEVMFWTKFPTNNQFRQIVARDASYQAVFLRFADTGQIQIYTEQNVTGYTQNNYTQVGTYSANKWYQFRLEFLFSTKRFLLSYRENEWDNWTSLKATGAPDYFVPMRSASAAKVDNVLFNGYQSSILYVDDVLYANNFLWQYAEVDAETVLAIDANDERRHSGEQTGRWYVWGQNVDSVALHSAAATTFQGNDPWMRCGVNLTGDKFHGLAKFFEGAIPRGTFASSSLNLYLGNNTALVGDQTLKAHKFLNRTDATYPVRTGWATQKAFNVPTWNDRTSEWSGGIAWQTAGAVGVDEVNLSDPDAPSMALKVSEPLGYKSFAIPTAWMDGWINGADFSMGVMIKAASEDSGTNKYPLFAMSWRVFGPVWEVTYAAVDPAQFVGRKVTHSIQARGTFSVNHRHMECPDDNSFAVLCLNNLDNRVDVLLVEPGGRMCYYLKDTYPGNGFNTTITGPYGLRWDPLDKRWVMAGTDTSQHLCIAAASMKFLPRLFVWFTSTMQSTKTGFYPRGGVVHFANCASGIGIQYVKHDHRVGAYGYGAPGWSTPVTVVQQNPTGTVRTLAAALQSTDVMDGAGEISLSGSLEYYPDWGSVQIDSEYFWYTGKNTGANKLTGVRRATYGSSAANHGIGATVSLDRADLTYSSVVYDAIRNCLHVTYVPNHGITSYTHAAYLRHILSEADNVWRDEAGNQLALPVTQQTERRVGVPYRAAYATTLNMTSEGHLIVALTGSPADIGGLYKLHLARLAAGGTAFVATDTGLNVVQGIPVDVPGPGVRIAGTAVGPTDAFLMLSSNDEGVTWDADFVTLSSFSLPNQSLWCAGATELPLGSDHIMFAHHFVWHGAFYLQRVTTGVTFNLALRVATAVEALTGFAGPIQALPYDYGNGFGREFVAPFAYELETFLARAYDTNIETLIRAERAVGLPVEWDGALQLNLVGVAPIEARATLARVPVLPVESVTGLQAILATEIEALRQLASRQAAPYEYQGSTAVPFPVNAPIEAGGGIGRPVVIPFEAAGLLVLGRVGPMPIEARARLAAARAAPIEASGLSDKSLADEWTILQPLRDLFLEEWNVVPIAVSVQFLDEWNVQASKGMAFLDIWNALPQQVMSLFNADIQMPSGKVTKT